MRSLVVARCQLQAGWVAISSKDRFHPKHPSAVGDLSGVHAVVEGHAEDDHVKRQAGGITLVRAIRLALQPDAIHPPINLRIHGGDVVDSL
jgi:hypothetical protein